MTTETNNLLEEREKVADTLSKRLEAHDDNRRATQERLHEICGGLRKQIDEFEDKVNTELEEKFTAEDNRLQTALGGLNRVDNDNGEELLKAIERAKAELLGMQSYEVVECDAGKDNNSKFEISSFYELKTEKRFSFEMVEVRKPRDFRVDCVSGGRVSVEFIPLSPDFIRVLSEYGFDDKVKYKCLLTKKGGNKDENNENETDGKENNVEQEEGKEYTLKRIGKLFSFTPDILEARTTYEARVKTVFGDKESEWSDEAVFTTPDFKECCGWIESSGDSDKDKAYSIDEDNPRVATKINDSNSCTIIGNSPLPLNQVISWNIKVLKSLKNDGGSIYVGVGPSELKQSAYFIQYSYGWQIDCFGSTLVSGPPHNYKIRKYGPRKGNGQYVRTGDNVGVVMDTTKGNLSFVVNGVNLGVAYEGIPLDKPLVPCIMIYHKDDSVELDMSEAKENVDSSISVPSNIMAKSSTNKSITLTWDIDEIMSLYQVEVDGTIQKCISKALLKISDLPENTEHTFRVRVVKVDTVSEWSDVVKGRTQKTESSVTDCAWKDCPDYVDESRKYSVEEENPRIATNIGKEWKEHCTIIGNTPLPLNKMTSWSIKILKSRNNDGNGIYVGVAPSDIDQNEDDNYSKCGWYFCCYGSILWSGPPHNYKIRKYGPRKGQGEYVHIGDSVGVVMDTAKGELSFVLNGVNLGVAFEGIPLDKPLVPCVLLGNYGDSVELDYTKPREESNESCVIS